MNKDNRFKHCPIMDIYLKEKKKGSLMTHSITLLLTDLFTVWLIQVQRQKFPPLRKEGGVSRVTEATKHDTDQMLIPTLPH